MTIDYISLKNIDQIMITPQIVNQSAGRKFEVLDPSTEKSSLCTMNNLYLRAKDLYKEAHSAEDLKKLDAFIFKLFDAEDLAAMDYREKDNLYKVRTFFHRVLGGSFFGTHTGRLKKLLNKIEQKSNGLIFTEKAYQSPPKPKNFEGELISFKEFSALCAMHRAILDEDGPGTHGSAFENLQTAFTRGHGNTNLDGEVPFFSDVTKNQEFMVQFREVMTLISRQKPVDQQKYMRVLAGAFRGCNPGRVQTVQQISDTLLFNQSNPDFEGRVQRLVTQYKITIFDQLIREMSRQDNLSYQIPHLTSGYLVAIGEQLGLSGSEEAKADKHKCRVDMPHANKFIKKFKSRLGHQLGNMVNDLVREINNPNGDFHPVEGRGFGTWLGEKVRNHELPLDFAYYVPGKNYSGLTPVTEEQEDNLKFYISRDEVKHILAMFNYLDSNL